MCEESSFKCSLGWNRFTVVAVVTFLLGIVFLDLACTHAFHQFTPGFIVLFSASFIAAFKARNMKKFLVYCAITLIVTIYVLNFRFALFATCFVALFYARTTKEFLPAFGVILVILSSFLLSPVELCGIRSCHLLAAIITLGIDICEWHLVDKRRKIKLWHKTIPLKMRTEIKKSASIVLATMGCGIQSYCWENWQDFPVTMMIISILLIIAASAIASRIGNGFGKNLFLVLFWIAIVCCVGAIITIAVGCEDYLELATSVFATSLVIMLLSCVIYRYFQCQPSEKI